jgi:hypothetical protein
MAGLDELFPDAAERPGVALPPAPHGEPAGSRRLGIVALVLGAFALVSELGALLTGIAVFASILGSLGAGSGTDGLDWVVGYEWGSAIAGLLLGVTAVVIGVWAVRRRRGRRFGVAGAILGGAALLFEVVFGVLLLVLESG